MKQELNNRTLPSSLFFSTFCGEKLTAHVGRPNSRGHLNSQNFFFLSQTVDAAADATVCVCIYLSVADGGSHHYTQLPDHPNRRGVVVVVLCRELGREIRATSFDIHHHGVDCSIDLHRDVLRAAFWEGGWMTCIIRERKLSIKKGGQTVGRDPSPF